MNDLLDKIKSLFKKETEIIIDPYSENYENQLLAKYGYCNELYNNIRIIAISDTHCNLDEEKFKEFLNIVKTYDMCILLGDHSYSDVEIVLRNIDKSKLYGILGNHDQDYLTHYQINNLDGNMININGVNILGMQGSYKYKPSNFPSYTQEESLEFSNNHERADIFVTHDRKFCYEALRDPAHKGLIGITNYIYKNKVNMHLHGHIHDPYHRVMLNNTQEISVYGFELITK